MTEGNQPLRRGMPGVGRAIAVLCALVLGLGFAAPAFAEPGDDGGLDLNRYSKWTRPLLGVVVGLDPGHNGGNFADLRATSQRVSDGRGGFTPCDTLGTSTMGGYTEHELAYDVAQVLTERLEYLGATVVSTRTDNDSIGPCVDVRGRFAEDNDVDLLLSLHASSNQDRTRSGFHVAVADPALSPSQDGPSRQLAEAVVQGMGAAGLHPHPGVADGIAERADLATLNFARRPAVQVELGEMQNPADAELMTSEEGRLTYAEALAESVVLWHEGRDDADRN